MRIISQDGKYSFPFKNSVIICESSMIHATTHNTQKLLAAYDSPKKARKVMDMIHKRYEAIHNPITISKDNCLIENISFVFRMPNNEEIEV